MRPRHLFIIIAAFVFAFALSGCEGDAGPEGPQGPPGPSGVDSEFTFVGKGGEPCQHCHLGVVESWSMTGHSEATSDLDAADQENPYCMQCHTTGWDRTFTFGQAFGDVAAGPDTEGYDDYFEDDSELGMARKADLAGVQCEACHGAMGPDFNAHRPEISFATHDDASGESLSLCSPCHSNQLAEWATSGHAFYDSETGPGDIDAFNDEHYVNRSSCDGCHTSEGFIRENDPAYASYEFPEEQSFIGCVTCHDPHAGEASGGNVAQLRTVRSVEVAYIPGLEPGDVGVPQMEGKGGGQTCAQCHHARRDTDNVTGQIANGYAHFGPHSSPQMDMYLGYGSYEVAAPENYGGRYDTDAHPHYSMISNACVTCHMANAPDGPAHRLHNFEPNLAEGCGCHGADEAAVLADIGTFFTDFQAEMDGLAADLGFTDAADFGANYDSQDAAETPARRAAAYALQFVLSDGSEGAHNPDYATSLISEARASLTVGKTAGAGR